MTIGGAAPTALDVLYVHPSGHLNDLVVPSGALTCMNGLRCRKLGRYSFEVSDDEILAARVIATDVHWALALSGFERFVAHVRTLRPTVPLIVGGVTAGHYPREILARYAVDYVLQGDSELAFARLVEALLGGGTVPVIENVHARSCPPPPLRRMSRREFDETDCLTADWFPTYAEVTNWDTVAFPQGRTIAVARGCPLRCPECYGSYASTYGRGYLLRSPAGAARLLRRAQALRVRNLRLFVAKPTPRELSGLVRGIATAGPFRFDSAVGIYLCRAPDEEALSLLESAFENTVVISMVPPEEQSPPLSPQRLEEERRAWRAVGRRVARSTRLELDVWATKTPDCKGSARPSRTIHPRGSRSALARSGR